ncbi:hypothetical protein A3L11_09815 [Thermococcus siculi]|uniref:Uncharacterized protein n=2 Tax=Thermococcus siculi TaxID=72803 RepID=A0A2Z2MQ69_9EURY|nr:hypothetical protein A3L11_09815 [Thermococcus siculi]
MVEVMNEDHVDMMEKFDAGSNGEEQTKFARENAWNFHSHCLATVFVVHDDIKIISYFTLSPFIIRLKPENSLLDFDDEVIDKLETCAEQYDELKDPVQRIVQGVNRFRQTKHILENIREVLKNNLTMDIHYSSVPSILLGQFGLQKEYRYKALKERFADKDINNLGGEILERIIIPYAIRYGAEIGGIGLSLHANKTVAKKFYLNPEKNPLAEDFYVVSFGGTYELLYPFVDDVIGLRKWLLGNDTREK